MVEFVGWDAHKGPLKCSRSALALRINGELAVFNGRYLGNRFEFSKDPQYPAFWKGHAHGLSAWSFNPELIPEKFAAYRDDIIACMVTNVRCICCGGCD